MSKKKFTSGLESLFGTTTEEAFQEESPLLDTMEFEKKPLKKTIKKRSSSKDFTSDLDTLFELAMAETIEEKSEKPKASPEQSRRDKKVSSSKQKPKRKRRLSGLDALIRRTDGMDVVEVNIPTKKRVSFICDKEKIAKLKEIAKQEKAYLKDIIGEVVSNFIEKYEKEQKFQS